MNNELERSREALSIQILPSWLEQAGIQFLFLDGNKDNWEPTNVTYRFTKGPLECPFHSGFFYVPGFSRYAINQDGSMIVVKTGKERKWTRVINSKESIRGGYVSAPCVSDNGIKKNLSRHRALCLTFKEYSDHPSNFIVNHKNGIGGDDRLDNLEFCTYSQNTQHAYDNGLYANKLAAIDVINWITGFEKSYPSIVAFCRESGLSHNLVTGRLNGGNERRHEDGWRIKRSTDAWLPLNERVGQLETQRSVTARNIHTGVRIIYSSIGEASRETGIGSTAIRDHCAYKNTLPLHGWNFRFIEDFAGWPNYSEQQIEIFKDKPIRPGDGIEVHDLETNQTLFFTSAEKAGEYFDISPITASKLARYEGLRNKRFKFKLVQIKVPY